MNYDELKFFCVLPWVGLAVSPNARIHSCCMQTMYELGNLTKGDLLSQYNSDEFKTLRLGMLRNEIPMKCYSCNNGEKTGGYSLRKHKNDSFRKYYKTIEEITNKETGELSKLFIKDTDIRPSNLCNFKCQMCSSTCSIGHAKAQGKETKDYEDLILSHINPLLNGIDVYHFAGGEPFLMESTYKIMDHYIKNNNNNVQIGFSTNLSTIFRNGVYITEYLKKFKHVVLNVSIDGYGKICEEQRVGCKWENLISNLLKVRIECPNIRINSHTVVTVINCEWIPEFMEWLLNFKYTSKLFEKKVINTSSFNVLTNPIKLNIQNLDKEAKLRIKNKYEEFKNKFKNVKIDGFSIEGVLNYIERNIKC
jgi:molybdenum cofactor biosynthesis enzyme MoaA